MKNFANKYQKLEIVNFETSLKMGASQGSLHKCNNVNLIHYLPLTRRGSTDLRYQQKQVCKTCSRNWKRCGQQYKKLVKLTNLLAQFGWVWDKVNEQNLLIASNLRVKTNASCLLTISEKTLKKVTVELVTQTKYLIFPLTAENGVIAHRFLFYLNNDLSEQDRNQAFLLRWLILKDREKLEQNLRKSFSKFQREFLWLVWQSKSTSKYLNSSNLIELIGHRTNNKEFWKVPPKGYHWNNSDRKEIRAITCLLTQKKGSKVSGLVAYKTDLLPVADFDRKNFNQEEWLIFEPQLKRWIKVNKRYILWITRTLNGGYHITFKAGIKANSLQNSLFWKGKSRGQLQWGDKYAVSGVSQGYTLYHPQQFLHQEGLIKRTPKPTLNRPKLIKNFNHLGLLILRLGINLLDNSGPTEWQITFANFFANKKNKRLNKKKEHTMCVLKKKSQKYANFGHSNFEQNFKTKLFESKIGNSDPPLDSQIAKVVKKVNHFEVKMKFSSDRYVENMSFFGGSRTSEYWNISLSLTDNCRENFLVDFGHRPELRKKLLNKKVGDWITINYQTLTNQFGHSANFIIKAC